MNDRNDFEPSIRNAAWWASDTRQAIKGNALETVLIKQGKLDPPDLSNIEAVQMGHVMQPVIGRLAQDKLKMELKDADYSLYHSDHKWFASHFDFITADGRCLVEAKNYNASVRHQFDPDTNRIPAVDYAQLVHEAAVHNVDRVILAVLFGGQEFHTFEFDISEAEKSELIKNMAVFWAHVQTGTTPEPRNIEDTKLLYPQSTDGVTFATQEIENMVSDLKAVKSKIKELETISEQWELAIRNALGSNQELRTFDGNTLATWKSSKPSMRFSTELFKSAMPDIFDKFVIEQAGSRRFLIK
jgi:predicted phage-related endonuclease